MLGSSRGPSLTLRAYQNTGFSLHSQPNRAKPRRSR